MLEIVNIYFLFYCTTTILQLLLCPPALFKKNLPKLWTVRKPSGPNIMWYLLANSIKLIRVGKPLLLISKAAITPAYFNCRSTSLALNICGFNKVLDLTQRTNLDSVLCNVFIKLESCVLNRPATVDCNVVDRLLLFLLLLLLDALCPGFAFFCVSCKLKNWR